MPVLDALAAGIQTAEVMVRMGITHSLQELSSRRLIGRTMLATKKRNGILSARARDFAGSGTSTSTSAAMIVAAGASQMKAKKFLDASTIVAFLVVRPDSINFNCFS